jgi:hypothetical protein
MDDLPVVALSRAPTSPEASSLFQLPTEVIVKILALLDTKELLAFHTVKSPPPPVHVKGCSLLT